MYGLLKKQPDELEELITELCHIQPGAAPVSTSFNTNNLNLNRSLTHQTNPFRL